MSFCSKCGGKLDPEALFCANCGTSLKRMEKTKPRKTVSESVSEKRFDIKEHIRTFQREGMLKEKGYKGEIVRDKWNPKKYVEKIALAIGGGGFSYFRYVGEARTEEYDEGGLLIKDRKKVEVQDKSPLLLSDEELRKVGDIQTGRRTIYQQWGPLYFTGRRFIFETKEFSVQSTGNAEYSLPMWSYWIKPDFTELLSLINLPAYYVKGRLNKRLFNKLSFKVLKVGQRIPGQLAKAVACDFVMTDTSDVDLDNFMSLGSSHRIFWAYAQKDQTLERLGDELQSLISEAKETKVTDLIIHTYQSQREKDAMIDTSFSYGPREIRDHPYSRLGGEAYVV